MAVKKPSSEKSNSRKRSARNSTTLPVQSNGVETTVTVHSVTVSEYEIRRRAYELFEARGRRHGYDWDDWIQAETELRSRQKEIA